MPPLQRTIIQYLRKKSDAGLRKQLAALDDQQIAARLFFNLRGEQGLRLTQFGLQVMCRYFQHYKFRFEQPPKPVHLVFLDRHARMPYFCDNRQVVVFDTLFGSKLQLVDGDLSLLMEID